MRKLAGIRTGLAATAGLALAVSGCGIDSGVEFNGKIFDAVGVGTNSEQKAREARIEPRSPLVPPPRTDRLPVPGEETNSHMAWPTDPEQKQRQATLDAEKKRAQACEEEKKYGSADDKRGEPHARRNCGSILSLIWGTNQAYEPNRPSEQAVKQMPR
ncbi:MAG: hypothetical protein F9K44_16650 [Hyphomicrobiaceae bacterium]|nr:MAG: hypothetical protein F9K44_16650 [Hyphomicrobiaceae bacterium]